MKSKTEEGQSTEDSSRSDNTLYDIMMDIYINTYLPKPRNYITSRVNPEVNYELWVIMMSQCMFIFG